MAIPLDHNESRDDRTDLTPLIDLVFLLLVFFILTTQFKREEEVLWQLLPTDRGAVGEAHEPLVPPDAVAIVIVPGDVQPGADVAELDALAGSRAPTAVPSVRLRLDGEELLLDGGEDPERQLERIHTFLIAGLQRRELAGLPRDEQDPIELHCFSGLPYKYALMAYDVVREHEIAIAGKADFSAERGVVLERRVAFAPPRLRDYTTHERGRELRELLAIR